MTDKIKPYAHKLENDNGELLDCVTLKDDRQISLKRYGYGDEVIFELPGSPGSHLSPMLRSFILSSMDVTVYSVDRPGYGYSSRKRNRKVIHTAYAIEQVADALDVERFSISARSGGVAHALGCAALMPDRVIALACVSGLAPPAVNEDWTKMSAENYAKHARSRLDQDVYAQDVVSLSHGMWDDPSTILNHIYPDLPDSDKELLMKDGTLWQLITNSHDMGHSLAFAGWYDDTLAFNHPHGWGFKLEEVQCPTIFWQGGEDPFCDTSNAIEMQKRIPGSAAIIHPSLGHFGELTQKQATLAYLAERAFEYRETGVTSQASFEALKHRFAIQESYKEPEYPTIIM